MNKYPLISVLVPCYNHQYYIIDCLDSISNNKYSEKEIVIIDDGSTDSSVDKIRNWIKNNPAFPIKFIARENKGFCVTLNELIKSAAGEYIALVASDDLLTSNSLDVRISALLNNPLKLVVIGDAKVIDTNGEVILDSAIEDLYYGKKENYLDDERLKYSVIHEWSIPGPVMMARKDLYDIIGPYPENLLAEDLNFYMHVISKNLLIFIDETVASYRVHDLNMCRNPKNLKRIIASIIRAYMNNFQFFSFKYKVSIAFKIFKNVVKYAISTK